MGRFHSCPCLLPPVGVAPHPSHQCLCVCVCVCVGGGGGGGGEELSELVTM